MATDPNPKGLLSSGFIRAIAGPSARLRKGLTDETTEQQITAA